MDSSLALHLRSAGYDPATGRELWRVEDRRFHTGTVRPVFGHGLIFAATGLAKGEMWAIRPGGSGVPAAQALPGQALERRRPAAGLSAVLILGRRAGRAGRDGCGGDPD